MYLLIIQQIFAEALIDIGYFPVWWYSRGALGAARSCYNVFLEGNARLAPWLWFKNLLVPMFGQYDWQGRIISFIMRFIQVIFRTFFLLIWAVFSLFLLALWFVLPIIVLTGVAGIFMKSK